jgi:hypothetical protein
LNTTRIHIRECEAGTCLRRKIVPAMEKNLLARINLHHKIIIYFETGTKIQQRIFKPRQKKAEILQ